MESKSRENVFKELLEKNEAFKKTVVDISGDPSEPLTLDMIKPDDKDVAGFMNDLMDALAIDKDCRDVFLLNLAATATGVLSISKGVPHHVGALQISMGLKQGLQLTPDELRAKSREIMLKSLLGDILGRMPLPGQDEDNEGSAH